ncbi:Uncharacterized protein Rs2_02672 [Raphanus sativus]|nr:Uncharacterized protein Rs2_02672 [Raphanus sativus]
MNQRSDAVWRSREECGGREKRLLEKDDGGSDVAIPEHLIKLHPAAEPGLFDLVGYVISAVEGKPYQSVERHGRIDFQRLALVDHSASYMQQYDDVEMSALGMGMGMHVLTLSPIKSSVYRNCDSLSNDCLFKILVFYGFDLAHCI